MRPKKIEDSFLVFHKNSKIPEYSTFRPLDQKEVKFKKDEWKKINISAICRLIKEWKCQQLYLHENQPKILQHIEQVKFPKLACLFLTENNIVSIERLNRIQLPLLQTLHISRNCISDITDLRKARFPKFQILSLDNNNINDLSPLCGLSIQIMGIDSSREKGKGSNLGIFAKNPSSSELQISTSPKVRIKQHKVIQTLKKKYENIEQI